MNVRMRERQSLEEAFTKLASIKQATCDIELKVVTEQSEHDIKLLSDQPPDQQ